MNAWFHLLKKELRNGAFAFFALLIGFLIVGGIVFYFSSKADVGAEGLLIFSASAIVMHIFYLVYYLFISLHNERKKLHLWLHSPMPSYALLLAKIVAGLISLIVSLAVAGTTFLVAAQSATYFQEQLAFFNLTELSLFASIHIILLALNIASWFLLFMMIHFAIRSRLNGFLSFISTAAIVILSLRSYIWFIETNLYETLTMWGSIHIPEFITSLNYELSQDKIDLSLHGSPVPVTFYIGDYVFEAILSIALFLLACWLLERKVEV